MAVDDAALDRLREDLLVAIRAALLDSEHRGRGEIVDAVAASEPRIRGEVTDAISVSRPDSSPVPSGTSARRLVSDRVSRGVAAGIKAQGWYRRADRAFPGADAVQSEIAAARLAVAAQESHP